MFDDAVPNTLPGIDVVLPCKVGLVVFGAVTGRFKHRYSAIIWRGIQPR